MSKLGIKVDGREFEVELTYLPDPSGRLTVVLNGEPVEVVIPAPVTAPGDFGWLIIDGRPCELGYDRDLNWISGHGGVHHLEILDREAVVSRPLSGDGRVKAPIPGHIARLFVEPGQAVEAGQPLLVLEAMKMENEIRAPVAGSITHLNVQAGQDVPLNHLLVEIG